MLGKRKYGEITTQSEGGEETNGSPFKFGEEQVLDKKRNRKRKFGQEISKESEKLNDCSD